jgi:hypothetical protein
MGVCERHGLDHGTQAIRADLAQADLQFGAVGQADGGFFLVGPVDAEDAGREKDRRLAL